VKDLKRMVQRLGVELRSSRPKVPKADFLLALHERCDALITPEQMRYCLDQWSWPIGRKAMQDIEAAAEGLTEDRQLMLPMSLSHIRIPKALPIVMNGVPETVTAVFANIEQGDAYTDSLKRNSLACINRLTHWQSVWEPARKVMVEFRHLGWDFGRALEYLAEQEGGGMVPVRSDDPDDWDGD
jgi:hypothetical protein